MYISDEIPKHNIFTFFTAQVFAQTITSDTSEYQNFWQYGKEVGINVTPLLRKFVPFNLSPTNTRDNLLALKTKWYGKETCFYPKLWCRP